MNLVKQSVSNPTMDYEEEECGHCGAESVYLSQGGEYLCELCYKEDEENINP